MIDLSELTTIELLRLAARVNLLVPLRLWWVFAGILALVVLSSALERRRERIYRDYLRRKR
jgi:hypothetical protein